MTAIPFLLDLVARAGCSRKQITTIVGEFIVFEQRELAARRAAAAAKKRDQRARNVPGTSQDKNGRRRTEKDVSSSPEVSPHTPLPNPTNSNPPSPPKGGSSPTILAGWDDFWVGYPNKVGKAKARKAYGVALTKAEPEALIEALAVYAAKRDDQPWCNPATWLNEERWHDQPATVTPRASPRAVDRTSPAIRTSSSRHLMSMFHDQLRDERSDRMHTIDADRMLALPSSDDPNA